MCLALHTWRPDRQRPSSGNGISFFSTQSIYYYLVIVMLYYTLVLHVISAFYYLYRQTATRRRVMRTHTHVFRNRDARREIIII